MALAKMGKLVHRGDCGASGIKIVRHPNANTPSPALGTSREGGFRARDET